MYLLTNAHCFVQVAPPDHPAGTTWVWSEGSGVVLKAKEKALKEIEQRKAEQKEEVGAYIRSGFPSKLNKHSSIRFLRRVN